MKEENGLNWVEQDWQAKYTLVVTSYEDSANMVVEERLNISKTNSEPGFVQYRSIMQKCIANSLGKVSRPLLGKVLWVVTEKYCEEHLVATGPPTRPRPRAHPWKQKHCRNWANFTFENIRALLLQNVWIVKACRSWYCAVGLLAGGRRPFISFSWRGFLQSHRCDLWHERWGGS